LCSKLQTNFLQLISNIQFHIYIICMYVGWSLLWTHSPVPWHGLSSTEIHPTHI